MSLADELLADLGEVEVISETPVNEVAVHLGRNELDQIARIWNSPELKEVMERTQEYRSSPADNNQTTGSNEEYASMVTAIDSEIVSIHKYLRDVYSKRFPELENLILDPLEYARTVKLLQNNINNINARLSELNSILRGATVMVITMTSTTYQGELLTGDELERALQACDIILQLADCRSQIFEYVQSRMDLIAPNLAAVVGGRTAAQLVGSAGGLLNLSRIPACNIPMLGSSKRNAHGLSSANPELRSGFLYESDLVQSVPQEFRKRAIRVISAKLSLACRVDVSREAQDGSIGRNFRKEIDFKIESWQEAPSTSEIKALDVPDDIPRRKRGGKRQRKAKERTAITELQRQANRVQFGVAEEEVMFFDETEGLGMLSKSQASGKVRAAVVDNRVKTKLRQQTAKMLSSAAHSAQNASGLSSLVFTPVQGMELVDPEVQKKRVKDANEKWLSSYSGFVNVQKKK